VHPLRNSAINQWEPPEREKGIRSVFVILAHIRRAQNPGTTGASCFDILQAPVRTGLLWKNSEDAVFLAQVLPMFPAHTAATRVGMMESSAALTRSRLRSGTSINIWFSYAEPSPRIPLTKGGYMELSALRLHSIIH
jgi:hypothetical protein